jgi:hypothetical protein
MLTFGHLDAEESEQVDSRLENLFPLSLEVLHEVHQATYERKKRRRKRMELTLAIGGCFSHGYALLTSFFFIVKQINK